MPRLFLRFRRLFLFWALLFVALYVASFFLFELYVTTGHPLAGVAGGLVAPLSYFAFGWLYYRKAGIEHWPWRLAVIPVWIVLSVGMAALLIKPVYGYDWTAAINLNVLQGQLLNVAAMLVAAYVGSPSKKKKDETDGLEGPKF